MTITLSMLLDFLMYHNPDTVIGNYHSCPVQGVKLLPEDDSDWVPGYLYVGADGAKTSLTCGEGKNVMLDTDLSFKSVFNVLQDGYSLLRDWDMNMHIAMIKGETVQELLDMSLSTISNPITFLDPSFKLVAYTKDITTPSKIYNDILKFGCLPAKTVEMYEKTGFFSTLLDVGGEQLSRVAASYISVIHAVLIEGNIAGYVSMPCTNKFFTEGEAELFEELCENIRQLLERNSKDRAINQYMYAYFLSDLIEENETDTANLSERAQYIGLPMKSKFQLIKLQQSRHAPLLNDFHARKIADMLPNEKVFIHKREAFVLLDSGRKYSSQEEHLEHVLRILAPYIRKEKILCGVGQSFEKLPAIRHAVAEAEQSIAVGEEINSKKTLQKLGISGRDYASAVFRYADYYLHHMILAAGREIPYREMCSPHILSLIKVDQKEKTNHLQVLYEYLRNERRLSKAADSIPMHRNSVVYRIEKIEEMVGVSLEDEGIRQRLWLSFAILELMDV